MYITKPFHMLELVVSVDAAMQRQKRDNQILN